MVTQSRAGAAWVGICIAAMVLTALILFMLQNRQPVLITFLSIPRPSWRLRYSSNPSISKVMNSTPLARSSSTSLSKSETGTSKDTAVPLLVPAYADS